MNVRVKAKKILEPMSYYYSFKAGSDLPRNFDCLLSDEELIGYYENEVTNNVLVTTKGIHVVSKEGCLYTNYEDIAGAYLPDVAKRDADLIELKLVDGRSMLVPIRHGNGKFRDVFEFVRFIDRVTSSSQL